MTKLDPAEQPPYERGEEVVLWAARGEAEPAQIVVRAGVNIAEAHVRVEDLTGPGRIPEERIVANFVGWVNVDKARALRGRAGLTPDPLLPNHLAELKAGTTEAVWLTIYVPRDAAAGEYTGRIWIQGSGVSLPVRLRLHVFDFALPTEPTFTELVKLWNVPREKRPIWWANLAQHRIAGETYPGMFKLRFVNETPSIDFSDFDAALTRYVNEYGLRLEHVQDLMIGDFSGFFDPSRRWGGTEILSPAFDREFTAYCRLVTDHLRAQGWLPWTQFQFWDEPQPGEAVKVCKHLGQLMRTAAPDAKIYLTAAPIPDLYGLVDVWCVPLVKGFPAEACAERRKAGDQIWAYDNRLYSLDVANSSLAMREFPWQLFGADVTGTCWWALNKWNSDPYQVPNQYPPQNGGGFLLYPARDGDEPVNSIRWEMVREGIEDHDYLAVLAEAINAARRRVAVTDPALSGEARAKALCALVAPSIDRATADARVLAATRLQVAREIVFYQQGPDVVFAVQPRGVGIVGRAESGTQIHIDGAEVPVADDGAFSWRAGRTPRVELQATQGASSKSLVVAL